jgi:hypothetical protein
MENKRGVSDIIMNVIMIVLVLTAVGVVWVVVQNILDEGLNDISLGAMKINLDIEDVKVTDSSVDVKVKRNAGEADLVGINFIVSDGENSEVFEEETDMKELATQTFSLDYSGVVKSVEIAPVLKIESGKEKVYDSVDKKEISLKESLIGLGVVSWWKLDGDVKDEIGYNDGTLIGDVDCSVEGVYGKACHFDGNGDYINVSDDNSLDFGENSFTISTYVKTQSNVDNRNLIYKGAGDGRSGWRFGISYNSLTPNYLIGNATYYYEGSLGNLAIKNNSWESLVIVYDRDSKSINGYVNGILSRSRTLTNFGGSIDNSQDVYIGNTLGHFVGDLDSIIMFNKALTEEQVKWLYEQDLS